MPLWRIKGKKWVSLVGAGCSGNHCWLGNLKGFVIVFRGELPETAVGCAVWWRRMARRQLVENVGEPRGSLCAGLCGVWQLLSLPRPWGQLVVRRRSWSCWVGKRGSHTRRVLSRVPDSRNFLDSPLLLSSPVWVAFWLDIIPNPCVTLLCFREHHCCGVSGFWSPRISQTLKKDFQPVFKKTWSGCQDRRWLK